MKQQTPAKPQPQGPRARKPGEATGTTCPVCGDSVLRQEKFGPAGAHSGYDLVCSRRGCPWRGRER